MVKQFKGSPKFGVSPRVGCPLLVTIVGFALL